MRGTVPTNPGTYLEKQHCRCQPPRFAYSDKKDYQHAIADYDEALKHNPHYAAALYNRGIARADSGDKDGAIADYREALKLRPGMKKAADALKELGVKP